MITKIKIDNVLVGATGVHYMVPMLSIRGFIATHSIRNASGIDLEVINPSRNLAYKCTSENPSYKVSI